MQYKNQVDGWWSLTPGKSSDARSDWCARHCGSGGKFGSAPSGNDVEDRINALAEALGMPPQKLASAIAGAVKEYVPPASLSSMSSAATNSKASGVSSAVWNIILGEGKEAKDGINKE
jgi:hypothetical protein